MRIEVQPGTPEKLRKCIDQFGSTTVTVNSKLFAWFVEQDELTIAKVLGHYQGDLDVTERILKNMAAEKKRIG